MLSHRLIQCLALLVAVSGLRSQCGARCLNPWRVVGFWLYLFERRVVPRSEPSEPQLGRIATGSQLAVVGCGRTLGSALVTSGTIEAVEQVFILFAMPPSNITLEHALQLLQKCPFPQNESLAAVPYLTGVLSAVRSHRLDHISRHMRCTCCCSSLCGNVTTLATRCMLGQCAIPGW